MRVALVSPYSHTFPGGVGRHVEELAEELIRQGHDAHLLAPRDPDDRHARISHHGSRPQARPMPEWMVPLGRSVGLPANGAVSNLALAPGSVAALSHALRRGRYDVVHVHEPNAPLIGWCATESARSALVGTFHTYATSRATAALANFAGVRRIYNKLHVRIAVSEAARWTCERFYGGRYRLIPNGVDLEAAPERGEQRHDGPLRVLFVGRAEERKGLPVLLRAFEAMRAAGVDAELVVAGTTAAEVEPLLLDPDGVTVAGRVEEAEKWRLLSAADVLCAPSVGGESFGMVLTEAFAAGTPAVASNLAGYATVLRDGRDGVLVPPGDPAALGEALRDLALDRERLGRMGASARLRAERYAWPRVASEVVEAYGEAAELAAAAPQHGRARLVRRMGLRPADGLPAVPPRRIPTIEPEPAADSPRRRRARAARRAATVLGVLAGASAAVIAFQRLGLDSIVHAMVAATEIWVLVALAVMCASMLLRAEAWHAILRAAMPRVRVRRRDTARATMIGVLMSATLPARLGEPSRALILSRRLGSVRERLPVVLGTLVSQTILNLVALVILGAVMFATVGLFRGHEGKLVLISIAPVAVLLAVLAVPALLRRGRPSRFARVQAWAARARSAMTQVRAGLAVFRRPRLGAWAATAQLSAWALQWLSCYLLLVALGLDDRAGMGAAAAVLFAVNVTAAVPAVPSNIGVFQAACVAVLAAYHVGYADALAYGIILQAVEIATAVAMGTPALVREGMTWRDMRLRALHAAPVELAAVARRDGQAEAEA